MKPKGLLLRKAYLKALVLMIRGKRQEEEEPGTV